MKVFLLVLNILFIFVVNAKLNRHEKILKEIHTMDCSVRYDWGVGK